MNGKFHHLGQGTTVPSFTLQQSRFQRPVEEFMRYALSHNHIRSVILFGSVAKGTAQHYSDVDLIVVIDKLPEDWRQQDQLFSAIITKILMEDYVRIFPQVCSPAALLRAARQGNPLLYGLLTGYQVLYDPDRFFSRVLQVLKKTVQRVNPIYIERNQQWVMTEVI